jgi:geranylgeranyl reductase family protein
MVDNNMYTHDVIIAGGGTAGLSLANLLIENDIDVCVVDRRPIDNIGDKICGDAIAGHHFTATGLPRPSRESVRVEVDGIYIYGRSLDYKIKVVSTEGGYIVDRHRYGQELLNRFLGKGGTLYDKVTVQDFILDGDVAKGIVGKKLGSDELIKIGGKLVIDATGYSAILIKKAPSSWGIEKEIEKRDIIPAYREVVELKTPIWEVDYLHLHFHSEYAPGGYVWLFPWSTDGYYLNYGNGIIGGVPLPKPRELVEEYAKNVLPDLLVGRRIIKAGQWVIPNRRPRHVFVGEGFLAVGDSAIMIDPATAEGIGYGMYGAYIASKVVREALEAGDYSRDFLWRYQKGYMSSPYGIRQARLDVFRILLQAHSDLDIEFIVRTRLLTSDELARARDEDDVIDAFAKFIKISKTILHGKYRLLKNLNYALKMMRIVRRMYENYPETPDGISRWILEEERLFDGIKERLGIYIPIKYIGTGIKQKT